MLLTSKLIYMKNLLIVFGLAALSIMIFSFEQTKEDPWKVPESYQTLKNPIPSDESSIKAGKQLYQDHCLSCHGKKGQGYGNKANSLNEIPSDFTTVEFQKQSDGSLLYKIYFGHKDMPGFKNKIPDNQDVIEGSFGKTRTPGDLINYLRTFSKK